MKKILFFTAIVFLWGGQISCVDLDTEPQDFMRMSDFYQTESDIKSALAGVYLPLGTLDLYGSNFAYEAISDDLGYYRSESNNTNIPVLPVNKVYGWNYNSSQPNIKDMWDALYEGIERANKLLEHMHVPDIDESLRNRYRAEALFLRGFYHFMLASYWGDVPLKLLSSQKITKVSIPPTPQKEVFLQCKEDMSWGTMYLDSAKNYNHSGRVTQTTAWGILTRLCLKMAGEPTKMDGMYEQAILYADSVVNSNAHRLEESYDEIFRKLMADEYDTQYRESMFEADFHGNSSTDPGKGRSYSYVGSYTGVRFNPNNDSGLNNTLGYCYGRWRIRPLLWQLYLDAGIDAGSKLPVDKRFFRSISAYTSYNSTTGVPNTVDNTNFTNSKNLTERYANKWRRTEEKNVPRHKNYTSANFPILRYSDVLLMLAEAENEVNGPTNKAHEALNKVRLRAGVPLYDGGATPVGRPIISDPSTFRQVIRDERARELCFEGLRKFDLVRWGIFVSNMRAAGDVDSWGVSGIAAGIKSSMSITASRMTEKYNLFPIPQSEINLNRDMKQNKYW